MCIGNVYENKIPMIERNKKLNSTFIKPDKMSERITRIVGEMLASTDMWGLFLN